MMDNEQVETKKLLVESILKMNAMELRARKIGDIQVAEELNRKKNKLRIIMKS